MMLEKSPLAPATFPRLPDIDGVQAATASRGFYASRDLTRDDTFLFTFAPGTQCAGVFTRSSTASADVQWCRKALQQGNGSARALIVNAGNSNAFTGPAGALKNAATIGAITRTLNVEEDHCFVAATGVIGEPLPDPNYIGAIVPELAASLGTPDWQACARAFMTTDTFPKAATRSADIDGTGIQLAGIAKGSGMIAPNMSTMLSYIFTDAAIAAPVLDQLLKRATQLSFNAVTVDGDTSTSDTLMVFATGAAKHRMIVDINDPRVPAFAAALNDICLDLACQLVRDGEGASKFIRIKVAGAQTETAAKNIAMSIANSPLVKTALAANDANWGRVIMAIGKSGEQVDQAALKVWFGDLLVAENGSRAAAYSETEATRIVTQSELDITVDVGAGQTEFTVYTCDLTHAYIDINGAYRT
ncbi:MAG: bifunctional glutamate N-acetyltransferase/amino-acid acetyltransferase ArgJ [Henriciella sp.]